MPVGHPCPLWKKNVYSTLLLVLNMDCLWGFCLLFWPCHAAFEILVPQPGVEPVSPAVEAQGLNHWTTREVWLVWFWCRIAWAVCTFCILTPHELDWVGQELCSDFYITSCRTQMNFLASPLLFVNVFPQFSRLSFCFVDGFLCCAKALKLKCVPFVYFCFYFLCFRRQMEKKLLWFTSKSIPSMFSPRRCMVLGLTFRSVLHLKFMFLYGDCMCSVTQLCLTRCNPVDCSLPGSSVHGIILARMLECHCTGDRDQDHPQEKEMQKSKMAVWGALQISVKRREVKS